MRSEQKTSLDSFKSTLSPNDESAAYAIKKAAQDVVEDKTSALRSKAKPLYASAYQKEIDPAQLKSLMDDDPNIAGAVTSVLKDPRFARDNRGYAPNSIKILDSAKKRIDAQIGAELNSKKPDQHLIGILTDSKNRLIAATDEFSPDYSKARSIYGEGAKPIKALEESPYGRIAYHSDANIEKVIPEVFDPNRYSAKSFTQMRDLISKKNPEAWNQGVRNEFDRLLDKTDGTLSSLHNKVFKGDRKYNLMYSAVKNIPGAQQKMQDLRMISKNIINPNSARAEAKLANTNMTIPKNAAISWRQWAQEFIGGRYDQELVEFITNPNWDKEVAEFLRKPATTMAEKAIKYSGILSKIATLMSTQPQEGE